MALTILLQVPEGACFFYFKNLLHLRLWNLVFWLWNIVLSHVNFVVRVQSKSYRPLMYSSPRLLIEERVERRVPATIHIKKTAELCRQDYPDCLLKRDCGVFIWLWYTKQPEMNSVWNCLLGISGLMIKGRLCWGGFCLFVHFLLNREG